MSDLQAPPVPADCDLRDFAFLPLEGRRLLTSETWILGTNDARCAALCLWIEAWYQVPAASLPDNERILAHLSQAGGRWAKVKAHAMRGWFKASDGRLYHPVLAEKALDAWARKQTQRKRTAAARAARHPQPQQHSASSSVAVHVTSSVTEPVTGSKGQGQGQGQGKKRGGAARAARRTSLPEGFAISERVRTWALGKGYHDHLDLHLEKFISSVKARGACYVDWDEALMNCIRDDWGEIRQKAGGGQNAQVAGGRHQTCAYCSDPWVGSVNNNRHCRQHHELALDNVSPAIAARTLATKGNGADDNHQSAHLA